MRSTVPTRVLNAVSRVIARDPRVTGISLFGSRAKGTHREGSDIDLAIRGNALERRDVWHWLEEMDDEIFPWSVDLVLIKDDQATDNQARQELLDHIERVGVPLFSPNEDPGKL